MEVKPDYKSIGSLFGDRNVFEIPKYQRGYAWEKEHVDDFVEDLKDVLKADGREHFYGCFVCAQTAKVGGHEQKNELIDGQQRLTTFLILIKCIVDRYKAYEDGDHSEYVSKMIKHLNERYFVYSKTENLKEVEVRRLILSRKDDYFFNNFINGVDCPSESDSTKRIQRCYRILKKFVDDYSKASSDEESLEKLQEIESALNSKCFVIHLITSNVADAYKLFQTINDRGRALSQADLIRAKSLGISDVDGSQYFFEQIEMIWDRLDISYGSDLEKYLGYYLVSVTGVKVKRTSFYDQFMALILDNGRVTPKEIHAKFTEIESCLKSIEKINSGEWPFEGDSLSKWERTRLDVLVGNLQHTHALPLLLSAIKLGERSFFQVVRVIEIFFYRFKLVCGNKIDPATKIYYSACRDISDNKFSLQRFKSDLRGLLDNDASAEVFVNNLSTMTFDKDKKAIKYFLLGIEESWRWISDGMPGGSKNRETLLDKSKVYEFRTMTLEHVYPQNSSSKIPDLEGLKHRIGNLTLLDPSLNSSIGNVKYSIKRQKLLNSSAVQLNRIFEGYDEWSKDSINNRQEYLIGYAHNVFYF